MFNNWNSAFGFARVHMLSHQLADTFAKKR